MKYTKFIESLSRYIMSRGCQALSFRISSDRATLVADEGLGKTLTFSVPLDAGTAPAWADGRVKQFNGWDLNCLTKSHCKDLAARMAKSVPLNSLPGFDVIVPPASWNLEIKGSRIKSFCDTARKLRSDSGDICRFLFIDTKDGAYRFAYCFRIGLIMDTLQAESVSLEGVTAVSLASLGLLHDTLQARETYRISVAGSHGGSSVSVDGSGIIYRYTSKDSKEYAEPYFRVMKVVNAQENKSCTAEIPDPQYCQLLSAADLRLKCTEDTDKKEDWRAIQFDTLATSVNHTSVQEYMLRAESLPSGIIEIGYADSVLESPVRFAIKPLHRILHFADIRGSAKSLAFGSNSRARILDVTTQEGQSRRQAFLAPLRSV